MVARTALVLVYLAVCALLPAMPGAAAPATMADSSLIVAALQTLEREYVKPVDPMALLNAAIAGLRKAASLSANAIEDIPAGTPEPQAVTLFKDRFAFAAKAPGVSQAGLAYGATREMLAALHDKHVEYLDPDELAERQNLSKFAGIGVDLLAIKDSAGARWVYIWHVPAGSPAEAAGLQRFDKVLQVEGKPLQDFTAGAAILSIRGPVGSTVPLTIQRGGQTSTVSVVRTIMGTGVGEAQVIRPGLVYVRLPYLLKGARDSLVERLAAPAVSTVVLDLRGNPGGLISEASGVAGVFLPSDTILAHVVRRGWPPTVLRTTGTPLLPSASLVILADSNTEEAAELLMVGLRDAHGARIVGERSAGSLRPGVWLDLPVGRMFVPVEELLGRENEGIDGLGVAPDTEVALAPDDIEHGVDTQLEAALKLAGGR